jgi:hypothetical protein
MRARRRMWSSRPAESPEALLNLGLNWEWAGTQANTEICISCARAAIWGRELDEKLQIVWLIGQLPSMNRLPSASLTRVFAVC